MNQICPHQNIVKLYTPEHRLKTPVVSSLWGHLNLRIYGRAKKIQGAGVFKNMRQIVHSSSPGLMDQI